MAVFGRFDRNLTFLNKRRRLRIRRQRRFFSSIGGELCCEFMLNVHCFGEEVRGEVCLKARIG